MRAESLPAALPEKPAMTWASDALAHLLSQLDLPFVSLVPGASYRGLHDSLVNYLGNRAPTLVLCLHEEHAVAVAHGYAKVTGKAMGVAIHSNVGLMHATMAVFNAYCDRVPMLMLGATGPIDAVKRRPWIDWIHTASDQGALVRNYCKWDDQPASIGAALEAVMRAYVVTNAAPSAPTYVCLDKAMQEEELSPSTVVPRPDRYPIPTAAAPEAGAVETALAALRTARRPLLLMGRVGRSREAWDARVQLAERFGACVVTDIKTPAAFPSAHPLHPAAPGGLAPTSTAADLMRRADVIVSLEWLDLAGTLSTVFDGEPTPKVIACTNDLALHNGWSKDHFGLAPTELWITADPDALVGALLGGSEGDARTAEPGWPGERAAASAPPDQEHAEMPVSELAAGLRAALRGQPVSYTALSGWSGADLEVAEPLDFLGNDGGAGVGSGPGIAVGAALALDGTGRMPVAVLGDGDFLMGCSALWTAAHHRLPLLVVVANNRSYFNDEVHQDTVARTRGRPVENRTVGLHLREPDPDLAGLARSLGLKGHGPVRSTAELASVLASAIDEVRNGEAVVVDVRVAARTASDNARPRAAARDQLARAKAGTDQR